MTPDALAFLLEEGLGFEEVDAEGKTPMDYSQEVALRRRGLGVFQQDRWDKMLTMLLLQRKRREIT